MIPRNATQELKILLKEYPIITILGPRQAGKTTLVRNTLDDYEYSNLETPETRDFAKTDPKAFLNQFKNNVILDEIQRVPELLSYIQTIVDEDEIPGRFVLTSSYQFGLHQSLAGRTAILNLLPLTISELSQAQATFSNFSEYCYRGFLPKIYKSNLRPTNAYSNYYQTYVERDVRQIINLKNISLFEKFIKLIAGRVGQVFNASSLANDVGVDTKTIQNWTSILEASFVLFKLPPYFTNFGKRAIKSPKYYFVDVGLLVFLLGIENTAQILRDPLVGNIFENLVVIECLKTQLNQGKKPNLYFYRDSNGNEIDLIFQKNRELIAIEIKPAATFSSSFLKGLQQFQKVSSAKNYLIYSGEDKQLNHATVLNFKKLSSIFA